MGCGEKHRGQRGRDEGGGRARLGKTNRYASHPLSGGSTRVRNLVFMKMNKHSRGKKKKEIGRSGSAELKLKMGGPEH